VVNGRSSRQDQLARFSPGSGVRFPQEGERGGGEDGGQVGHQASPSSVLCQGRRVRKGFDPRVGRKFIRGCHVHQREIQVRTTGPPGYCAGAIVSYQVAVEREGHWTGLRRCRVQCVCPVRFPIVVHLPHHLGKSPQLGGAMRCYPEL